MRHSVVKFITLLHRRCLTCFGHHYAHHQEQSQTADAAPGFRINAEVDVFPVVVGLLVDHDWKHIHLGIYTETGGCVCSLRVLLMMGVIMPETC
jgi:hypothetical protein